jgi:hypothetical protein
VFRLYVKLISKAKMFKCKWCVAQNGQSAWKGKGKAAAVSASKMQSGKKRVKQPCFCQRPYVHFAAVAAAKGMQRQSAFAVCAEVL